MKKILLTFSLALVSLQFCIAGRGFAIVVDPKSHAQASSEIDAYARAIEEVNHLKVYTLEDKWGIPDSIREHLRKMYLEGKIEGAVFIGDIPVPMIRDAQHLTSAFKMDQKMPRKDSSVPSDRFYDDFSLRFTPLGRDEGTPLWYYSLLASSAQHIHSDIYTGRIRPTDAGSTSRYDKLRAYLKKVVEEKHRVNRLDRIFYFTGQGSLNDSRVAAIDEKAQYYAHFPWLLNDTKATISYMDFSQEKYIKVSLMNELQREDLDLAILHHHGDYDTQYLNKEHKDTPDSVDRDMRDLHLSDFKTYGFRPSARFVIFDACYNGAFEMPDCIANEYIFSSGRTVACMAGTVNLLQDKWYDKYIGLLGLGYTTGQINDFQAYLESHIIGDPTFTFTPQKGYSLNNIGDGRALKLCSDYQRGKVSSAKLLSVLTSSPYDQERLQALELIAEANDSNTVKGLAAAASDRTEMIQRFAVNFIRDNGSSSLALPLVRLWLDKATSARVWADADMSIVYFPKDVLLKALGKVMQERHIVDSDSIMRYATKKFSKYGDYWLSDVKEMLADTLKDKSFNFTASAMRIYCPPSAIPQILDYISSPAHRDDRRISLIEAMGWYGRSYHAPEIAKTTLAIIRDSSASPRLRDEALRTWRRITGK